LTVRKNQKEKRHPVTMENMRKKLGPLFNSSHSFRPDISVDSCTSYKVTAGGTLHLLSNSCGEYNINELGLQKRTSGVIDEYDSNEKTYQCASHEMCIFGVIGRGASSVVQKAIHIPTHRILALKKINTFEKEKRHQLLNEIRTLCEAPHEKGLVEFHGAFYTPASGQISIALEYMDGGSLRDLVQSKKRIPEPILSVITHEILHGLNFLHRVRHLVHRDIKPANLLINLNGEPKITDFGISVGLENTVAMCGTFVGTVTYMSPERIGNEYYSFPADIWSLGLSIFECGTGEFPYNASKGPVNLMLQVIYDPSPSPSRDCFSEEFCSFVDVCLHKDPNARPTAEQLLSHPFIKKYENAGVDLSAFVQSIFDPIDRLKDLADMLTVHYYMIFDGPDEQWHHMKTMYRDNSAFSYANQVAVGANDIFNTLSRIHSMLVGDSPDERLVHVVENLQCCVYEQHGVVIRVSGSFVLGGQFIPTGGGVQVEGISRGPLLDIASQRMGTFNEQFIMEPGELIGCYYIYKQELCIQQ